MVKNTGQDGKAVGARAHVGARRTGSSRFVVHGKPAKVGGLTAKNSRTGAFSAKIKRVSDDGFVIAVDGRQRAHAFDVDEIQVRSTTRESAAVAVGEIITITSDGKRTKITLD